MSLVAHAVIGKAHPQILHVVGYLKYCCLGLGIVELCDYARA